MYDILFQIFLIYVLISNIIGQYCIIRWLLKDFVKDQKKVRIFGTILLVLVLIAQGALLVYQWNTVMD